MLSYLTSLPVQNFASSDISLLALAGLGGLVVGWAFACESCSEKSFLGRFHSVGAACGAILGAVGAFALVELIGLL